MNEIEIKVLDIDVEEIKSKVIDIGGTPVKKELQENHMYNLPPCTINQNGFIRIRYIHDYLNNSFKSILCVKKILSQDSIRTTEEHEVEVSDLNECIQLIKALDLTPFGIHKKYRESYKYKNCLIEFDTWDKTLFPNPYIEIEGPDESSIFSILDELNIPRSKATSKSLREITEEIKKSNSI